MKGVAKEIANTYKQISKAIQASASGQLFPTPDCTSLLLNFSSKTLESLGLKHSFSKLYQVCATKDSIKVAECFSGSFENPTDLKVKSKSPSGKFELRVRKPSIEGKETLILELWENGYLMRTRDISKKIKFLYNDPMFGGVAWSKDESVAAFVAEPADKTYAGVWEDQEEKKEDKKDPDPDPLDKHVYKEYFGDQMPDKTNPRLYTFDLKEHTLEEVTQAGETAESWPSTPLFLSSNEMLFHGYVKTSYKEGLIYCFNRPSALYYLKDYKDKNLSPVRITDEYMVFGSSISGDFKKLAYLAVEKEFIEHCRCLELRVFDWPKKSPPQIIVPTVDSPKDLEFPGIYGYHDSFSTENSGFLKDNVHYIMNTVAYGYDRVFLVNTATKKIVNLSSGEFEADEQLLVTFKDDLIILRQSSVTVPPYNVAIKLNFEDAKGDTEALVKSARWCKFNETRTERAPELFDALKAVTRKHIKTPNAEGYLYSPQTPSKGLIAIIHGGPHSSFANAFTYAYAIYFVKGYSTLLINYRGSIGYGQAYVQSLLGHIGEYDVTDCMECIEAACKEMKDGGQNVFATGGSHGGYLSLWLVARYPKAFKAAVVRNPVADIPFMASASDIPEWGFAEVLAKNIEYPPTESERKKMWERSPMSKANDIEAPVMLMLGAKDARVPMANVMPLYNLMKKKGKEVKLLYFPKDCHPLNEPETEIHSLINGLVWIEERQK
eukprot:TRINITY_DN4620_c0_g1_i17.p1 TRINITY_DN4620_c0_g1~~TRINITY_DN4620_c0_g1_i17.p1  ORF type:complete len:720 (-),score=192.80 TRINITY_DN4620_c0_g1_i17:138-2297(-)